MTVLQTEICAHTRTDYVCVYTVYTCIHMCCGCTLQQRTPSWISHRRRFMCLRPHPAVPSIDIAIDLQLRLSISDESVQLSIFPSFCPCPRSSLSLLSTRSLSDPLPHGSSFFSFAWVLLYLLVPACMHAYACAAFAIICRDIDMLASVSAVPSMGDVTHATCVCISCCLQAEGTAVWLQRRRDHV